LLPPFPDLFLLSPRFTDQLLSPFAPEIHIDVKWHKL
jgi:hypothetical protein